MREFRADKVLKPKNAGSFCLPEGFSEDTPVDLEIGCGVGWHPIRYAKANPDRFLIAVEHTREKFERFQSRLLRHPELKNILAVHADAVAWTTYCLKPASISRCFILYPNPNPKAPSKRWFRMPFMSRLLECLEPGGEITLATNIREYFDEALEFATQEWKLETKDIQEIQPHEIQSVITKKKGKLSVSSSLPFGEKSPRTHFEKKYLERGEVCFDARFQKKK